MLEVSEKLAHPSVMGADIRPIQSDPVPSSGRANPNECPRSFVDVNPARRPSGDEEKWPREGHVVYVLRPALGIWGAI